MNDPEDKTSIQWLEDCQHRLQVVTGVHVEFVGPLRDTQGEMDELARLFGVLEPSPLQPTA